MQVAEFRAMGSPCRVVVDGGPADLAGRARSRIERWERAWSRFLPDSGITQVNRHAGCLTLVSAEVYDLIETAERARLLTGGRFNPLMLRQLEDLGYRRPWDGQPSSIPSPAPDPASTVGIELFPEISAVLLPAGTAFDPGGIGKGLAADRAVEWLIEAGATTASVELGGDLRVHGDCWYAPRWRIEVADPVNPDRQVAAFTIDEGACTTSSVTRRTWTVAGQPVHHLLDPDTGQSAETDLVTVSTCASTAWWAEVMAKTALIAGAARGLALLAEHRIDGIGVAADGVFHTNEEMAVA